MLGLMLAVIIQTQWPLDRPDMGWTKLGLSDDRETLVFTRSGVRPNLVWVRYELRSPDELSTLSSALLTEGDCREGKTRRLQSTDFTGPNLTGSSERLGVGDWSYPRPGSIGYAIYQVACE